MKDAIESHNVKSGSQPFSELGTKSQDILASATSVLTFSLSVSHKLHLWK